MNSPRFTYWARLLFLPGIAVGLTSCVSSYGPGMAYGPPRYAETVYRYGSSSYNRYDPAYRYDSFGYRDYHDYGRYGYGYPYGYGYRRDYHDHDDDRHESDRNSSSSGSSSKSKEGYKIVAGSTGSKTRPDGYHSVGWYNSKGYDVNKLKLESRDGDRYRKSSSSETKSRDSGGSSRSSSEHRGGSGDHRSSGSDGGRSKSSGGGSSKSSGGGSGRGIKK